MNQNNELYHHGVLGMKWGKRKAKYYSDKVKDLTKKRTEVYNQKGAISNKFRKTSKELYLAKAKKNYYDAKASGNKADIMSTKIGVKEAKYVKRHGTGNMLGTRNIYGQRLTSNEMTAINIKEVRKSNRVATGKKVGLAALSVIGPLALTTVATEMEFKNKYGTFGIPSISMDNGRFKVTVKR